MLPRYMAETITFSSSSESDSDYDSDLRWDLDECRAFEIAQNHAASESQVLPSWASIGVSSSSVIERLPSQQDTTRALPKSMQPSSSKERDSHGKYYDHALPNNANSQNHMSDTFGGGMNSSFAMHENSKNRMLPPTLMHGKSSTSQYAGYVDPLPAFGDERATTGDEKLIYQAAVQDEHMDVVEKAIKRGREIATTRSQYWKSFEKFTKGTDIMARCLYCKRELRANPKNGTASLRNHLASCKAKHISDSNQPELVGMRLHGEKFLVPYKYDYESVRRALAVMIILDELPFKFVMGLGFKLFMEVVCPRFPIPSRWTIQRDCYQMFVSEKEKMRDFFKKSDQRVCLTTNTWTSLQKVNYMCVTAHYIDERWTMNKRLLIFVPIFSHKGKDIGIALEKCLRDWGIDKVFTITMDNASANDVAINYVRDKLKHKSFANGKFFLLRCVAHIVHLIVTDGLKLCEDVVSKIRLVVKYVKNSPVRYAIFKSAIALEDIQYKGWLSLDVKTRWNSTYKMLEAALKFEKAFVRYEDMDPLFKFTLRDDEGNSLVPTAQDWEKARKLVTVLRRFYNLTLRVSGYKSVSSHSFFHDAANLHIIFQKWKDSDDFSLTNMALPMCEKYEKYWGEDKMNMLFYVAAALDPRKKLKFLRFTLEDMYGEGKGSCLFEKVKKALYDLFDEYKCKFGHSPVMTSSYVDNERTYYGLGCDSDDDDECMTTQRINRFKRQQLGIGESNKSELDKYLGEDLEDDNEEFEILSWWKVLSSRFPILGHIARDVLAVPVSTVASEATFSAGGRILDAFRSSLSPRIVESLLCTQDWLRGKSSLINFEEDHDEMEELEEGFNDVGIDVYNKYID